MREIKFRAWDTKYELLIYINDLYWFEENQVSSFDDKHYVFEQYTGLKDKNGKEIYEGDIVDNCNGIVEIKYYNNLNFDSGGGVHSGFYYSDEVEYYDKGSKYWEVIGNIHENPEYLDA